MTPRLSGHISKLSLAFFMLKSFLGISRQWSREKFFNFVPKGDVTRDDSERRFLAQHSLATLLRHCFLKLRRHVRILIYRAYAIFFPRAWHILASDDCYARSLMSLNLVYQALHFFLVTKGMSDQVSVFLYNGS